MIFFRDRGRSERRRARDGQPFLASSAVRRQRRHSGLTGKKTRQLKNEHRRHKKGIDKSNIRWTDKPTRKDISKQQKGMKAATRPKRRRGWLW